tara:strand:+ start:5676 stop:5960 length:285 start_codon:yes stop_codon:yes gene_type:complete
MSKKTNKKNEEVPVKEDVVEEAIDNIEKAVVDVEALTRNALQLQQTAQNLANQLQQYMQLCKHYEKTINILTGRLEEQERLVQQLSANAQKEAL